MQKHKIGIHVSNFQRDGYGLLAESQTAVVSFDPGAFDEVHDKTIKIFRTHAIPSHKDGPGDFDKLPDEDLPGAAEWWWNNHLKKEYEPIRKKYGDNVYFQPINEINNPRTILYLRGMVKAAEKDGYKLALWGNAGASPDLADFELYWLPFMKEVQAGGHIYSRHAYSGVTSDYPYLTKPDGNPADDNSGRPFIEAQLMRENGVYMPMVITELGWLAGWNNLPHGWLDDALRYNELMLQHENIIGACLWNAGQWETAPNILSGQPMRELATKLATMQPAYWQGFSLPDGPDKPSGSGKHVVTVYLFPQDVKRIDVYTSREWAKIGAAITAGRSTATQSADDAAFLASKGAAGSKVICYGERPEIAALALKHNIAVEFIARPDKPPIANDEAKPNADGYLYGVDVSVWQRYLDYDELDKNIGYVIARAQYGASKTPDVQYKRNIREAKRTGRITGAYHFFLPNVNIVTQAERFIETFKNDPADFWAVDVEQALKEDNDPLYDQILKAFIDHVSAALQVKPFIYTSHSKWWELTTNPKWANDYPLWVSHYTRRAAPLVPPPWKNGRGWSIWQYTSTNTTLTGKNIDTNRFKGSMADLRALIKSLKLSGKPHKPPVDGKKRHDLIDYMFGPNGSQYMMQQHGGGQERYRIEVNGTNKEGVGFFVKNHQYEKYPFDSEWIYQDTDTSPGNDQLYKVRRSKGSDILVPRLPRLMHVGEVWSGHPHHVQFYYKKTCKEVPQAINRSSGTATNRAVLHFVGNWKSPISGRFFDNCALLELGEEWHVWQYKRGPVAWWSKWGSFEAVGGLIKNQAPMVRESGGCY